MSVGKIYFMVDGLEPSENLNKYLRGDEPTETHLRVTEMELAAVFGRSDNLNDFLFSRRTDTLFCCERSIKIARLAYLPLIKLQTCEITLFYTSFRSKFSRIPIISSEHITKRNHVIKILVDKFILK